jgi:hypothetical protein
MKQFRFLAFLPAWLAWCNVDTLLAQCYETSPPPVVEWVQHRGGTADDYLVHGCRLADYRSTILCGFSASANGDLAGNNGSYDGWLVKYDKYGQYQWSKNYGTAGDDRFAQIALNGSNRLVAVGSGYSTSLGATASWVCMLDTLGNVFWQKHLFAVGSTANSVVVMPNSNMVVACTINDDIGLVCLSADGEVIWQRTYGGSAAEVAAGVVYDDYNYRFFVAGSTRSNDAEVSGNHGMYDYWLLKLDNSGNLLWQKCLGGSNDDLAKGITLAFGTGINAPIWVTGQSKSTDGDLTGALGANDFWMVRLTSDGAITYKVNYGSTGEDRGASIMPSLGGIGFVMGGISNAGCASDLSLQNQDFKAYHINTDGSIRWEDTYGGPGDDRCALTLPLPEAIISVGYSNSAITGNHGGYDGMVVWLKPYYYDRPEITASKTEICINDSVVLRVPAYPLRQGTQWVWHSDSITGQVVGTGNTITLWPARTTTYYVAPEGPCSINHTCGLVSIVVNTDSCLITYVFTANGKTSGNWTDTTNWLNGLYPGVNLMAKPVRIQGSRRDTLITCIADSAINSYSSIIVRSGNRLTGGFTCNGINSVFIVDSGAQADVWIDALGAGINNSGCMKLNARFDASTDLRFGYQFATLTNHATGNLEIGDLASKFGSFNNYGNTVIQGGYIFGVGPFEFANQFRNYGSLTIYGGISGVESYVQSTGQLYNYGTIDVWKLSAGQLLNKGSVFVKPPPFIPESSGGRIDLGYLSLSNVTNEVFFEAKDVITEIKLGSVLNKGVMRVQQTNAYGYNIKWNGTLQNDSLCEISGLFTGKLTITNDDSLSLSGLFNYFTGLPDFNVVEFVNHHRMGVQWLPLPPAGSCSFNDFRNGTNYGSLYIKGMSRFPSSFTNHGTCHQVGNALFTGAVNHGVLNVTGNSNIHSLNNFGAYNSFFSSEFNNWCFTW